MASCGERADEALNSLSSLMASAFSLGQMIGPIIGSSLTTRIGFAWACTLMAVGIVVHLAAIAIVDAWSPRARVSDRALKGGAYAQVGTEMTSVAPQETTPSAVD